MTRISANARNYVRSRATEEMDATCRIERVTAPVYNETTLIASPGSRTTIYEGKCRVWELSSSSVVMVGENETTIQSTNLSIPWDVNPVPDKDDEALIVACPSDSSLVNKRFQIQSSAKSGALRPTRRFSVTELGWQK